jgi:hypothetical protein
MRNILVALVLALTFNLQFSTAHAQGGVTWTATGAAATWWSVASSADGTKLVAADGASGQIYTSADSGTNWTPRAISTNWQAVACSADGTNLSRQFSTVRFTPPRIQARTGRRAPSVRIGKPSHLRQMALNSSRQFSTVRFTPPRIQARTGRLAKSPPNLKADSSPLIPTLIGPGEPSLTRRMEPGSSRWTIPGEEPTVSFISPGSSSRH